MSWNKYFIVVKNVKSQNLKELINAAGYGKVLHSKYVTDFREASLNKHTGIGLGLYEDNFWIINSGQTEKFFLENPSTLEQNLCREFPNNTILAVAENGTVDAFGFNLIQHGKRLRVISGCDGEYEYEFGAPLEIEAQNLKRVEAALSPEERSEIIEGEGEDGFIEHIKFEALWGTPFDLFTQIFGKSIDQIYTENPMFEIYN